MIGINLAEGYAVARPLPASDRVRVQQSAARYLSQNKIDQAIGAYERWLAGHPDDLSALRAMARLYADAGRASEAIDRCLWIAKSYRDMGLVRQAVGTYRAILRLDPSHEEAIERLADILAERGLVNEAKTHLVLLSELVESRGDELAAVAVLKKLSRLDASDVALLRRCADSLERKGANEGTMEVYAVLADTLIRAGKLSEASLILEKAEALDGADARVRLGRAEIALREGDVDSALSILEVEEKKEPMNRKVLFLLATAYERAGRHDRLEPVARRLEALEPEPSASETGEGKRGFPEEGSLVPLGQLLLRERMISAEELEQALDHQRRHGGKLGSSLVELGVVDEEELTELLSQQLRVPVIDLRRFEIDPKVISLVPAKRARAYQAIPLSRFGPNLAVAMVDPTDVAVIDELRFMTGCNVEPMIAGPTALSAAIERYYR